MNQLPQIYQINNQAQAQLYLQQNNLPPMYQNNLPPMYQNNLLPMYQNNLPPMYQNNLPQIYIPQMNQMGVQQHPSFPDMLQFTQKMNENEKENSVKITKREISDLLTQDSYYRKLKHWPLLTLDEDYFLILNRKIDDVFNIDGHYGYDHLNKMIKTSDVKTSIDQRFIHINKLLSKFEGHLVVCGGAIINSIFGYHTNSDVDLFFYDLTTEEADKMRVNVIEFLINLLKKDDNGTLIYHIKRNEYTTTLYVTSEEDDYFEYQFIHRIYPDISSIIGGFDLSICMVAYDGKQIYTTPLGAWSIKNMSIIIDTKRRSTSFEHRLRKYSGKGIRLIFPGISHKLVTDFTSQHSTENQMINKMKAIAKDYGYEYNEQWDDFDFVGNALPENINYNIQKKAGILPYFKLTEYNRIQTPSYDRKNIEDRLINKISDYSSLSSHPNYFADINAQQLRSDNLHSVCSILKLDINKNIKDQIIDDVNNPNLMIDHLVFAKFNDRVEKLRKPCNIYDERRCKNRDFHQLIKYFGKLTPDVIEKRDTDEYYEYRDIMINKMKTNANICKEKLIGIKWITQNAGRQWTSSINPIIADPREWYGKHYDPVITGIPSEIESLIRLMRLPKTESVWTMINDDIFNVICEHLLKKYADDAWDYIK